MSMIVFEQSEHIATISLDRPDKKNALNLELFDALIDAGKQVAKNPSIRVVILKGNGSCFCAGLDLNSFMADPSSEFNKPLQPRSHGMTNKWQQAVWTWQQCPVPVIAAVHGYALGGGLQLMAGADIKIVHPETQLSIMEMKWGIIPDMSATQLWRHNVRQDILKELCFTNRMFSGIEAVNFGFATRCSEDPIQEAQLLADQIIHKNPDAIRRAKQLFNEAPYNNQEDGLLLESVLQDQVIRKENQMEAVFAQIQKRPPNFKD